MVQVALDYTLYCLVGVGVGNAVELRQWPAVSKV